MKSAWGAGQLGGKSNTGLVLLWCRLSGVSSASMYDPCILYHVPSTAFTPSGTAHQTHFSSSALFRSVTLDDLIRVRISSSVILVTLRMVCREKTSDGRHVATMNIRIDTCTHGGRGEVMILEEKQISVHLAAPLHTLAHNRGVVHVEHESHRASASLHIAKSKHWSTTPLNHLLGLGLSKGNIDT